LSSPKDHSYKKLNIRNYRPEVEVGLINYLGLTCTTDANIQDLGDYGVFASLHLISLSVSLCAMRNESYFDFEELEFLNLTMLL